MKILHLLYESKGDLFGIGGAGIRAYEIYNRIKDRHDITLICKKYPGASNGEIDGLQHIFAGVESKSLTKTLLSYAYHASRFVKRHSEEYDIIVEDFSPAIPTFLHAVTKKPIVLQLQGYTGKWYFKKYNLLSAVVLSLMELLRPRFYDNFIFVNSKTMNNFSLGKGKLIAVISNGISPELIDVSASEGKYILYLGRIDIYGKGLDLLIDAYKKFFASFPDIKLVIAGNGRDRERFKAKLTKLPEDIRSNIEMPGWVSGDKKRDFLGGALFVVLPSRHECQSIVALEAMGSKKAVIVSDIAEFNFVTDCGAGISFKTGDAMSLCQTMTDLTVGDNRKVMGERGRRWAKGHTWDKIALTFESFLLEVLEREH